MTSKVMELYKDEHLSNILVYEFEHITKKDGMCVIKVSFSQRGWFQKSKVKWNTTNCDNRMGSKKPFIPLKVTATCNILNHTLIYSISLRTSIVVYHYLFSQSMLTNGSPRKIVNMASLGGPFHTPQHPEDNSVTLENSSRTATGKDSGFGKQTNQDNLRYGYGSPPSQQPFPSAPQLSQLPPYNMPHRSQRTTSTSQGYPCCGPQCQGYDLHQGGYGGSQMFSPP